MGGGGSILESLFLLFESDTSKVEDGAKKSDDQLKKLQDRAKKVDEQLDTTGKGFVNLVKQAGGAIVAGLSVAAMTASILDAAANADAIGEFSEALALNIEDVSAWGDAVSKSGGTAEGFRSTLQNLTSQFAAAATTGKSRLTPFFADLGIQMLDASGKARDVLDVLPEIASAFEGLSRQESFGLGQRLGLDTGTVMLLQKGRREVESFIRRQRELGVVTEEAYEASSAFFDQIDDTRQAFRGLWQGVGTTLLPFLTRFLGGLERIGTWLSKHQDFVVGFFIAISTAITAFALPAIIRLGIATLLAFAPYLLIGAVVAGIATAFALLYDDVMNFLDGNDSLIGSMLEKYPLLGESVKVLGDIFRATGNLATMAWQGLLEVIQALLDPLGKGVDLVKKIGGFLGFGSGGLTIPGLEQGRAMLSAADVNPVATMTSSSIANSRSVTRNMQTGPITINTSATDAEGIAADLNRTLADQFAQSTSTFDDGVLA